MSSNPINKAHIKPSLANAVRGLCYHCMGGRDTDDYVQQSVTRDVRDCTARDCPLWARRPWRTAEQNQEDMVWAKSHPEERGYGRPGDRVMSKAYTRPESLRAAVTAKCYDCVGGLDDDGPRLRVRDCGATGCALWPVRPWQGVKGRGSEAEEPDEADDAGDDGHDDCAERHLKAG